MLGNWGKTPISRFRRVRQVTSSHCGPAVLEMLLSAHGALFSQNEIVDVAGVGHKLDTHGMTVDELATACRRLAPELQFWQKLEATMGDLQKAVEEFKHPVGVEWQGIFRPEDEDDDDGHYSVVVGASTVRNEISLIDPYYYDGRERRLTVMEFQRRWWDSNEMVNYATGRSEILVDNHLLFIVTRKSDSFPESLGMSRG